MVSTLRLVALAAVLVPAVGALAAAPVAACQAFSTHEVETPAASVYHHPCHTLYGRPPTVGPGGDEWRAGEYHDGRAWNEVRYNGTLSVTVHGHAVEDLDAAPLGR